MSKPTADLFDEPTKNEADAVAEIYAAYPRKVGKMAAKKAIEKALKHKTRAELLEATKAFAAAVAQWPDECRKFVAHPATWFNRGSYDDDRAEWQRGVKRSEFDGAF